MKNVKQIRRRLFWKHLKDSKVTIILTVFGIITLSLFLIWIGVAIGWKVNDKPNWLWFTNNTYVLTIAIILGVGTLLLGLVGGYQLYYSKLKGK